MWIWSILTSNAAVAGTFILLAMLRAERGGRLLRGVWLSLDRFLGRKCLGGAGDDNSIVNSSLDEPVVISITCYSVNDAGLAEIKVAVLTDAAVIMFTWHRFAAEIAVNAVGSHGELGHHRQGW